MACVRKKATQKAILLKKKSVLRYLFTSKHSLATKIALIRIVLKCNGLWELYERKKRLSNRIRDRSTEWVDVDVPSMDNYEFMNNFRLSRPAFVKLCQMLEPHIQKQETFAQNTIDVERRVLLTLYYLGQGGNFRAVANQFGVAVPTVSVIVQQVTSVINKQLLPGLITFPTTDEELSATMKTFRFPNCVGAIDGCHIKIKKPVVHPTDYYNRKGNYSLLIQGLCDGKGKFLSISCGHPGSIHDARMLRRSKFYNNVQVKRYVFPTCFYAPIFLCNGQCD